MNNLERITAVSAVEYVQMAGESLTSLANEMDSYTPAYIQAVLVEQATALEKAIKLSDKQ